MNNYKDKRWIEKRKAILKRDKYQCQECRRYGKLVDATHVHHCWPLEYYPEYKYCSWNLISLCTKCHNKMHDRESHELTTEGLKLKSLRVPPEEKNITPPSALGITSSPGERVGERFPTAQRFSGRGVKPKSFI